MQNSTQLRKKTLSRNTRKPLLQKANALLVALGLALSLSGTPASAAPAFPNSTQGETVTATDAETNNESARELAATKSGSETPAAAPTETERKSPAAKATSATDPAQAKAAQEQISRFSRCSPC